MDMLTCVVCGESKHWRRFREQRGNGVMRETDTCSTCRVKVKAQLRQKKKQFDKKVVLNRTRHEEALRLGIKHYYPDIEEKMCAYCTKKTAMDRKYLRDHQDEPLSHKPHLAAKQQQAREHAKGWIGFYDEICEHAINLLRQTGTRPPWAQLEGKSDLHHLYGVWHTKRAQLLRERG